MKNPPGAPTTCTSMFSRFSRMVSKTPTSWCRSGRCDVLPAQQAWQKAVGDNRKITVRLNAAVVAILGEDGVTGLRVRDAVSGNEETVDVAGVFIYAGSSPNTGFLGGLVALDETGRVPTDVWMRTERPGLFAAGDIRHDSASHAITAAGDGATAAVAAHRYIADHES